MKFEGKDFSTISDEMPSRKWDKEKFFSDWRETVKEYRGEEYIKIAEEVVIKSFYKTYEEILEMIEEEKLSEEDKRFIIK